MTILDIPQFSAQMIEFRSYRLQDSNLSAMSFCEKITTWFDKKMQVEAWKRMTQRRRDFLEEKIDLSKIAAKAEKKAIAAKKSNMKTRLERIARFRHIDETVVGRSVCVGYAKAIRPAIFSITVEYYRMR